MSYDVDIADEGFNYTFNLSRLWYDHIPDQGKGGGLREIDGLTGRQAAVVLASALAAMSRKSDTQLSSYNAPNGWGSAISAIAWTGSVIDACLRHPRSRVRLGL